MNLSSRLLLMLLVLTSCRTAAELSEEPDDVIGFEHYYSISDSIEGNREVDEWLEPYRRVYRKEMESTIATAVGDFTFELPESSLGNLAADMIRYRASHEMHTFVHVALISSDELKVELAEGDITLGDLHEMIPFDKTLVVSEIKGSLVRELAGEIAANGGAPVSGLRMSIHNGRAAGILVNSESLDPEKTYYIATSSDITNGSGGFESLKHSSVRHDTSLYLRDILIDYMKSQKVFTPVTDQRIRSR